MGTYFFYLQLHIMSQDFKLDISTDGWAGTALYPILTFDSSDSNNRSKVRIVSHENFKYQLPVATALCDLNWKQGLNSNVEYSETEVEDFIQVQKTDEDMVDEQVENIQKTLTHRPESSIASTRANRDLAKDDVYFEIELLEHDADNCVAIGVGSLGFDTKDHQIVGWSGMSYGYHSDDGGIFVNNSTNAKKLEKFGQGDIIGCGCDKDKVYFTKNGQLVHTVNIKVLDVCTKSQATRGYNRGNRLGNNKTEKSVVLRGYTADQVKISMNQQGRVLVHAEKFVQQGEFRKETRIVEETVNLPEYVVERNLLGKVSTRFEHGLLVVRWPADEVSIPI